ncbi:MAG: hypothetical protein GTO17_09415 [Candidatus Aminicenantes bacterium]|nr:hypothetical protein [Candidatus Aminicenantes bacterium]
MKKNHLFSILVALTIFCVSETYLNSQTCSCAGIPLYNPLEFSTLKERKWHFELTYKYHVINDLVEGSEKIQDDTERKRIAHFLLFDTRYALTRNFTLRAVFSLARQEREVGISTSLPVHTQGLGDSLLTLQYSPFSGSTPNQIEFSLGGGVKMPLGQSEAKIVGIASEDMQPGTGSWDYMIWGYASRNLPILSGLQVFAGVSSRFNGSNSRDYKFGNEIIASFGVIGQAPKLVGYSLYGRYRWAGSDKRLQADIPNTGGHWVYLVPGLTFHITKDMGFKTEGEIPLYRKLSGVRQFTTTFLVSFSFFYEI